MKNVIILSSVLLLTVFLTGCNNEQSVSEIQTVAPIPETQQSTTKQSVTTQPTPEVQEQPTQSAAQQATESLSDMIKEYIKSTEIQSFCYTGPSPEKISVDEKDSDLPPNLFVEDVKTETRLMTNKGGDKTSTIFVFAKIKNSGKTIGDFAVNYDWTYTGDSRIYTDKEYLGPIFSDKYAGGLKDPSRENAKCESGYPWTPIKFGVKSGDKVTIILDPLNIIKESNESDNEFSYIIK